MYFVLHFGHGPAHDVGDVFIGKTVVESQKECALAWLPHVGERLRKDSVGLCQKQYGVGRGGVIDGLTLFAGLIDSALQLFVRAAVFQKDIASNSKEPRRQASAVPKLGKRIERAQEGFLGGIIRGCIVSEQIPKVATHARAVPFEQGSQCRAVSLLGTDHKRVINACDRAFFLHWASQRM